MSTSASTTVGTSQTFHVRLIAKRLDVIHEQAMPNLETGKSMLECVHALAPLKSDNRIEAE